MVFCGTGNMERILLHPAGDAEDVHWIDIMMSTDTPTFAVTCCCSDDWFYEFYYTKSDYDRIKYNIMECIFESDTLEELLDMLSETFEDGFADILVDVDDDDDDECDGDCEHCDIYVSESKYLN